MRTCLAYLLLALFWLGIYLPSQSEGWSLWSNSLVPQPTSNSNKSPPRFELKFQNEPDNSTIIKSQSQQLIFKCQVKLAPVTTTSQRRPKFKFFNVEQKKHQDHSLASLGSTTSNNKWQLSNVSLQIDWFKDDKRLDTNLESSLVQINVELRSNTSSTTSTSTSTSTRDNDKITATNKSGLNRNRNRIEIKNTLNGNQLKLTSRLKLNQVKATDSGRYKCIARATFIQPDNQNPPITSTTTTSTTEAQADSTSSSNPLHKLAPAFVLVEQTLESNGSLLLVTNQTTATATATLPGKF